MKKKKLRLKKTVKKRLLTILIIILSCIFLICLYNIINWHLENNASEKELDTINKRVIVKEREDSQTTTIIEPLEDIPKNNPYWDYIKLNLLDVDLSNLKSTNSDVVGWIQVSGTNINYPFVQTTDNEYYLTHSFDKSPNKAGWVFMDYRNDKNTINQNMIIYAHARLNGTMFGNLREILTSGWLDNPNNYVVKVVTENNSFLFQVFSVYKIVTTSDYIKTEFNDDLDYQNFLDMILSRSEYNFNTSINYNDKIITLSTCYDNTSKVVLHAKLIKMD